MINIPKIFSSLVFNESVMKEKLSSEIFEKYKKAQNSQSELTLEIANSIAVVMKEWAISKGATHFAHWFQPLNGFTAEKQDSFISKKNYDKVILSFSGKDLLKSEPDASSFPSGGLRSVFNAKGYAVWDPTSFAFVRDGVLHIPAVFCSFTGEILDKKIPLLKSMKLIDKYSRKLLNILSAENITKVTPVAGIEQEFFLIDEKLYQKRMDLQFCGRTLFCSFPANKQNLNEYYFGKMNPKVTQFMNHLDIELWKLGILSKTKHCEAAPNQFEITPIYAKANIAADNNKLAMEIMKELAAKYKLVCIFHEKPFDNLNGSGKHLNWSLNAYYNENLNKNLFELKENKSDQLKFFLFLSAVIKAIDENQDLLKMCTSSYQNDLRLGSLEAPPNIISLHLGDEMFKNLRDFSDGKPLSFKNLQDEELLNIDIPALPNLKKDLIDRNRSSPFVFSGNRFEFRMPGSSSSIAVPIAILNIIVADQIDKISHSLENSKNIQKDSLELISETIKNHGKIIFNGNNYSDNWKNEALARGLTNFSNSLDNFDSLIKEKNIELFSRHKIYSKRELSARRVALSQNYCKTAIKEFRTLINMVKTQILPASLSYMKSLSQLLLNKEKMLIEIDNSSEKILLDLFSNLTSQLFEKINRLENLTDSLDINDIEKFKSKYQADFSPLMSKIKTILEQIEENLPQKYLPYPSFKDLLFTI